MARKKSGIVNVRMVITEEKILSNIDKVEKLINPNSKKQIVQLDDDTYFKDLVESIKTYLIEYPKKKNFPPAVYKAAYGLVEYATNQFEENTKKIEELIRQRETNIGLAGELKEILDVVDNKEKNWKNVVKSAEDKFQEDIIDTLGIIGRSKGKTSQNYIDATKLIKARISNLEANLHIEIDMERIEDRSKALSYIGIEIADALKSIPEPMEEVNTVQEVAPKTEKVKENVVQEIKEDKKEKVVNQVVAQQPVVQPVSQVVSQAVTQPKSQVVSQNVSAPVSPVVNTIEEDMQYIEETHFEAKPSLWQRIKNSKVVRAIKMITKIRIRIEIPDNALPEGRGE